MMLHLHDTSVSAGRQSGSGSLEQRARQSMGVSAETIYQRVALTLEARHVEGELFLDVGCGSGNLYPYVRNRFRHYVGVDAVHYDGFPAGVEFLSADLDVGGVPLGTSSADAVAAVETIEHLENPRAFLRELTRLAKPGGWVIVTTPNQLSLLSKMTLLLKNRFNAFQEGSYPAHLTALLEVDLRRIAAECRLIEVEIDYTRQGRLPFTSRHHWRFLTRIFPRALSDNVILVGRKAA
jgi:2-polyprenyl-3-methyl-5-hydroxy-6-metoxy-1,4-benzoquinol methylase